MTFPRRTWARAYCLLAGLCDASTGLLLVALPAPTLALMRIPRAPVELVWLQWIGVFVGAVGLAYLYPFVLGSEGRDERLKTVLEITAGVRLAVGVFVLWAVGSGRLPAPWLSVAATDLLLAAVQLWLLWAGTLSGKERG
ncbi:MAG: hypothetical protein SX243_16495 [Acidobacteriota bacterium]|nr:hypothetical protein [Acidobacteriota bacterium]